MHFSRRLRAWLLGWRAALRARPHGLRQPGGGARPPRPGGARVGRALAPLSPAAAPADARQILDEAGRAARPATRR
jgi:hypothetical protein